MEAQEAIIQRIRERLKQTVLLDCLTEAYITYEREIERRAPGTLKTRATHLKQLTHFCRLVGILEVTQLNRIVLDEYFVYSAQTRSQNTVNTGKRIIKCFLKWLRDYKEIDILVQPEALKSTRIRNKKPKALKKETIKLAILNEPVIQNRLLIATCYEGGLRISELVGLNIEHIGRDYLHILGKNDKERTVYITEELSYSLRKYCEGRMLHEPVFINENEKKAYYLERIHTGKARDVIQAAFDRINAQMTPHHLRHSIAHHLFQQGCDIITVQRQLGHEHISTTEEYLRLENDYIRSQVTKHMGNSILRS